VTVDRAQIVFSDVAFDLIISALVICSFVLLGVGTYRYIVRTRRRPRS